jgi:DNA-directed RNA polymerase I, II, and III subunit RPABC2
MSYFGGNNDDDDNDNNDNNDERSVNSNSDDSVVSTDEESEIKVDEQEDDEIEDEDQDGGDPESEPEDEDEEEGQDGGDPESEPEEVEEEPEKKTKRTKKIPAKNVYKKPTDYIDDEEDDDEDGEQYLQKFDQAVDENYILNFHPESALQNYDEILSMTKVVRNSDGIIIDKLHRTIPFITKYEKARILGQRAKQINSGAYPFVKVPENVIDGYIIAELELKQKRIPFIIRRPLPNGGSEYWKVQDLEDISF